MKSFRESARRAGRAALLLAAFLIPFSFASRGTDWTVGMHPDELAVKSSMNTFADTLHPNVGGSVYPEGFFVIANLYRKCTGIWLWMGRLGSQEDSASRDLDKVREPVRKEPVPSIGIGRRANAVLAGISGVLLFLAVKAAVGSSAGGLCAVLLGASSPFVVEHAHYCESDISFVFGLSLALLCLFKAVRGDSDGWMVASAAACAAAFACKYTVAPLVPFCVAVQVSRGVSALRRASSAAGRRRALVRFGLVSLACLAAALAAYVLLTPLVYVDFGLYADKIFRIYHNVHAETSQRDLDVADAVPLLRLRYVLRLLLIQLRVYGGFRLAMAGAGALVLLTRVRRNPCGAWLVALVLSFVVFDLAAAPWIRSQEFIPFAVLLGLLVAMAVGRLERGAAARGRKFAGFAVASAGLALCAAAGLPPANRVARQFSSIETRSLARRWLEMASNPDTRFAAGRFASPSLRGGRITTAAVFGDAESRWRDGVIDPDDPGHEYFMRQTLFPGRGFVSNATGELHPRYKAGFSNFLDHAVLLKEWKNAPGYSPTFCQLPLQMWAIARRGDPMALPAPLAPRATAYCMGQEPYDAAQSGDWLGPIEALRTVGARKRVRFVPPEGGGAVYAVTRHLKGLAPAKIKWEGLFEPREKTIAPGEADWFIYRPGAMPPAFGDFCERTRVRMRGNDQTSLCLTTVTSDPVYAAELLLRGGSPERAAALLAAAGLPADVAEAATVAVRPVPESAFGDFARIRFARFTVYPDSEDSVPVDAVEAVDVSDLEADAGEGQGGEESAPAAPEPRAGAPAADTLVALDTEFPVAFDPGRYEISCVLPKDDSGPRLQSLRLDCASSQSIVSGGDFSPGAKVVLQAVFDKPSAPRLCGESIAPAGTPHAVTLRDFQISWDPAPRRVGVRD